MSGKQTPLSASDRMKAAKKNIEAKKNASVFTKQRKKREEEIDAVERGMTESVPPSDLTADVPAVRGRKPAKRKRQTTTIVMDPELKEWVKEYCWRHKIVLSDLIQEWIENLKEEEEKQQ